jgi:hypothetical protein
MELMLLKYKVLFLLKLIEAYEWREDPPRGIKVDFYC